MSLLEMINQLCVDLDNDMREQRRDDQRRKRFVITKEWVYGLERCPDWPTELIDGFGVDRILAAEVAALALAGDRISHGDAVWLLLQPKLLPMRELELFATSTAHAAVGYAAQAAWNVEHVPGLNTTLEDFRNAELLLRSFARGYSLAKNEPLAQRVNNASRACGLRVSLATRPDDAHRLVERLAHCAVRSGRHPAPELERQLKHLYALVT